MCHIVHMKTLTVRELHLKTGHYVREGAAEPYVVTERGRPVALLAPLPPTPVRAALPDRESAIRRLPRIAPGSEAAVRAERDRR